MCPGGRRDDDGVRLGAYQLVDAVNRQRTDLLRHPLYCGWNWVGDDEPFDAVDRSESLRMKSTDPTEANQSDAHVQSPCQSWAPGTC
jgi:hypothetical protein